MDRRNLVKAAVWLPIGFVVSRCTAPPATTTGTTGGTTSVATVASDSSLVASGFSAILPFLTTLANIPASLVTTIQNGIATVQSAAASLTASNGAGASLAQTLASGVSSVVSSLSNFTVPSWVTTILSAAQTLLPLILSVAGVALAAAAPDPRAVAAARAALAAYAA
jgi:hypothetical protein